MKTNNRYEPIAYVLPAVLIICLVFAYPVIGLVVMSLERAGTTGTFVGVENYQLMLSDDDFWISLQHNLQLFLAAPILVLLALVVAFVVFERLRGWRVYRAIVFLPTVLPIVVVGIVFSDVFKLHGSLNVLLASLRVGILQRDWLGSRAWALWTLMAVIVWRQLGFGVVLFLARLMALPEELVETAHLDGATWYQRFRHVVFPQARPVVDFFAVLTLINMLAWVFNYVFVLTYGGPGRATYVMELYIYQKAFRQSLMGFAAAAAEVILIITLLVIVLQRRVRRRFDWELE